ncbi:MAG: alpha/beta fold hydrolase [Tannerellaceae bacterium]|jgi:pimeloyl-ACP methyl ester carboxylesterase|nr:alpha/beta fold hydrolase [Tannerellaceae bacterium]
MKQLWILSVLILFSVSSCSYSSDITGKWYGRIDMGGFNMRIVFDIKQSGYEYSATMQSPDQTKEEIPVTAVTCEDNKLIIRIDNIDFLYKGKVGKDGIIRGSFTQMGQTQQLDLSHTAIASVAHTQEPMPPFPYQAEEVTFENNEAGIRLAGTLTLPQSPAGVTAVVLISGSGPQNRNEEILGHKPFLVLADYLTRQGIAVLRFDDRGVEESQGDYSKATLADFATDVKAAVAYLKTRKEINKDKIGLIGHSEGGGIAFMLASQKLPAFIITLAGVGITGPELLAIQRKALFQASAVPDEYIDQFNAYMAKAQQVAVEAKSAYELREGITKIFTGTPVEKQIEPAIQQLSSPEIVSFLQYDPKEYFKNIQCPVFALNGMRDLQVPSGENLSAILNSITANGNKNVRTKPYFNLNHLFQTAMTGLPNEYGAIEETFNEEALRDLSEWIKER